jgi:hypothetical protein
VAAVKKVRGRRVRNMHDIVDYAIKSKRFIGGLGRLKKNGKIAKINGQVFARKTSKAGNVYVIIDNFLGKPRKGTKKRWQMVLLKNLTAFNENGWSHVKRAT